MVHGGKVVGIRLRAQDGFKWTVKGSRPGAFVPQDQRASERLYVCEGATDAAALVDMGCEAVVGRPSNTTGDEAVAEYAASLRPVEAVVVVDRDEDEKAAEQTREGAEQLADRLERIAGTVRTMAPPEGVKDARQWRRNGATVDDIEAAAAAAEARGPAVEVGAMIEAEISGERSAVPWPWTLVDGGTQALLPGTVTLVVGDGGAGKSLWLFQAFAFWRDRDVPAALYELEENRAHHLKRMLAQRVGAAWLTDNREVRQRPEEARSHFREHAGWLDRMGRALFNAPATPPRLENLVGWIEDRPRDGCRVIAIDPVTAAETSDRPWDDSKRFLQTVKPMLERYSASLVLVAHPKKTRQRSGPVSLDDLAGGAAWGRFAQAVLWLEKYDEPKEFPIKRPVGDVAGPVTDEVNRSLRILKARNGRGGGWHLAYDFDPASLRFFERGAIVKREKTPQG